MNRKARTWFIYFLCLAMVLLILRTPRPVIVNTPTPSASTELRGVWLTNVASPVLFIPWRVNHALHQLSQMNFNTVYPVVWNRGHTFYPSAVAKRVIGRPQDRMLELLRFGQDVLAEIVKQGNKQGLKVIPWFEYGFMTPPNSALARRHPDWITVRQDSTKTLKEVLDEQLLIQNVPKFIRNGLVSKQVWLNPLHPQVQKFIRNLIVEVVTKYDVAGIQLDDHFGLPVELGYDAFTVQLYRQEHQGQSPPNDPLNEEWMRWRANKISDFMQQIFKAVKAVKPNAIVSLSPNSQDFSYRAYLQDWQYWVQRGWVEELVVQIYRDDLKSFVTQLSQPALEVARRHIPVGVGILTGTWGRPVDIAQISEQVKAIRDRGFDGVSFFYWESLWGYLAPESPRQRRKVFQALFPASAKPH
ncbi:FenI [uncultured Coleofasciculus sp.]|uniref:FenI n=1 Tax=uncultured Coleofasciculus sp. TaxID=1267456 RepID=A0A6J4KAY0_9CYAN|nr:FenI [uncultured Coleofasciculus sp.]